MPLARTWEGVTLRDRVHRAGGRAIVGLAVAAAVETKRVTHVQFGTLRRSVHAAPVDYVGDDDMTKAEKEDMSAGEFLSTSMVSNPEGAGPTVEIGSWLPYACAEWVGRGHPGVTEGLESVRGARANRIVMQAFREEGL